MGVWILPSVAVVSSNQESSERSKIMSKWLAKFQTQQEEHILTLGLNKKHSYPLQGILSTGAVHPCIKLVESWAEIQC